MERPSLSGVVPGFAVRREIGRGAMGVVYEAEQEEPRRVVALKVLRGGTVADEDAHSLFRREIRALARLDHPSIATLYASGRTSEGLPWFAMELAPGLPFDAWLTGRPSIETPGELAARLRLFVSIAGAVSYAHERGVLHRDLKPSNLVVSGEPPSVKVLDFGLARITDPEAESSTRGTAFGVVRGTVEYMSPEQLSGNPEALDERSDVWALGVVLYEAIAGRHPLDLESSPAFDVPRRILEEPPASLPRGIDADLRTIVAKSLEKERDRRYRSVRALSEDVERYLAGLPIAARPPSTGYQLRKLVARHKGPFAALVAFVVLLAGFGVSMAVFARHLAVERDRANAEAATARANARAFSELLSQGVPANGLGGLVDPSTVGAIVDAVDRSGSDWRRRAETLKAAGLSLFESGYHDAGIAYVERAAAIERDADPGWPLGGSSQVLGELYVEAGRAADAEPIARSILEAVLRAGDRQPRRALGYAKENLGCALRDLGRYDEAESLLREALAIYTSDPVFRPELTASAHDSLGNLHFAKGELEAAETEHRSSLRIREANEGPESLRTIRSAHLLGVVLAKRGKTEEAKAVLEKVLAVREAKLGPDHPDTVATREALASLSSTREASLRR